MAIQQDPNTKVFTTAAGILAAPKTYQPPTMEASQQDPVVKAEAANTGAASLLQENYQQGTVEGRTDNIIAKDSPLMQRAAAKANIAANARGLRNSNMAVGAAQNAVLDAAAPIANADASNFNNMMKSNQDATNDFAKTNAGMLQQTNLTNASAENTVNAQNANFTQDASKFNSAQDAEAGKFNAQQENAMNTRQAELDTQISLENMNAQNKMTFDQMDQSNKERIIEIEGKFKNEMQANQTSAALFSNSMDAITAIQENTTMNAETKQRNVNQIVAMLEQGLNLSGSIGGMDLASLIDFSATTNPSNSPNSGAAPEARPTVVEKVPGIKNPTPDQIEKSRVYKGMSVQERAAELRSLNIQLSQAESAASDQRGSYNSPRKMAKSRKVGEIRRKLDVLKAYMA